MAEKHLPRGLLGAVAMVAVVAAVVPVLHSPMPAPKPTPVDIKPVLSLSSEVYGLELAGGTQAYAVRGDCVRPHCFQELRGTDDGRTWTPRKLPVREVTAPAGLTAQVHPLGLGRLVADTLSVETEHLRWYSHDSGRSWVPVAAEVTATTDRIPAGTVVEARCPGYATQDCPRRIVVTLPTTGERRELAAQPGFAVQAVDPVPAGDGNWWVSGWLPDRTTWAVGVTRDQGRTWSVAPLTSTLVEVTAVSVVGWGPAMYAVAQGPVGSGRSGLSAIHESTDGGATWHQTWRGDGVRSPRTLAGSLIVRPNGHLLAVSHAGQKHRSTDGGRTFEPVDEGPELAWVRWTRAGYLSGGSGRQTNDYLHSPDGVTWTELRVG
ncbi:WD40/YVTN/BNR-like repeat-containing protein [Actinokineospora sp.]|uniref:WD40/YVTN/BNR-like repeat-containing protein n=1 Tax=Actinokineospora sp. TaxID=1872133 RepID=UPI004037B6E0